MRLTLDDIAADSRTAYVFDRRESDIARAGGLRSGSYRIDRRGTLVLDGLAFVPGVTLSGRVRRFGGGRQRGRLRVGGSAAPHGLLTIERGRVSGRLGGRRVHGTLNAPRVPAVASAQRPRWRLPLF